MTLPYTTILVTTDFSPLADAALPVALRLAKDHGARLLVQSVIETPPPPSPLYAHYYRIPSPEEIEKTKAEVRERLAARLPADAVKGVKVEMIVSEGDAATEIARVAREQGASLLVIATHGRTGVKHFLLGSVAERVLRKTSAPVLLVR